jgi:lycopene cyclase domain-containing protein
MWKSVLPSIIIIGAIFIAGDIFFIKSGIWGFNPAYHSNIMLISLPVEEWLFFLFIPYASIFLHYVIVYYYPHLLLSNQFVKVFMWPLTLFLLMVIVFNYEKTYTLIVCSLVILSLVLALFNKTRILNRFFISFLIILIPFFILNALLTGTFIPEEVVWYNNSELLGIRLLTVPIEDMGYAFSLILLNLLMINRFQKVFETR